MFINRLVHKSFNKFSRPNVTHWRSISGLNTEAQIDDRVQKILDGERSALSRTVTLIESSR